MDSAFRNEFGSNSSKVQIQKSNEVRRKFSNAKSISSFQFFGDQNITTDDAQSPSTQT
ncbi:ADP-ribosylation factor GTPase-activating protein AGD9 [Spatholobus suberectus]|nr:ADP-ribosylation factor GTPase-activating protein AGD9 [Spatholobus suberectus]